MFTVCPKCALTLVVTAADLRVAQGYVRCGRCSSVFNALARLTDDRQVAESLSEAQQQPLVRAESHPAAESTVLPARPEAHGEASQDEASQGDASHEEAPHDEEPRDEAPQPAGDVSAKPEEVIPESALEFDPSTTDVGAVFIVPPPDPAWTAATGTFKSMIAHAQATAPETEGPSLETVSLEGSSPESPSTPSTPGTPSVPSARSAPEAAEAQPDVPATAGEPDLSAIAQPRPALPARNAPARGPDAARTVRPRPSPRQTLHERPPAAAAGPRPAPGDLQHDRDLTAAVNFIDESAPSERHGTRRVPASVWAVAGGIAALVLLAQIVHHHRDELAARAGLNRPLTALYAALGIPLVPRWDVRAYDVRQLGAVANPAAAGLITVRASIKNGAQQAQPLPLLRVTLQDRFGNRIAARDVAPRSYLSHAVPASSFLGAGQRIDAEMGFVDPGANAVGFEIDACLPQRGGGIACANDSAAR